MVDKPTLAIESPNKYAKNTVIPFATLIAFLETNPVNDTPITIVDRKSMRLIQRVTR